MGKENENGAHPSRTQHGRPEEHVERKERLRNPCRMERGARGDPRGDPGDPGAQGGDEPGPCRAGRRACRRGAAHGAHDEDRCLRWLFLQRGHDGPPRCGDERQGPGRLRSGERRRVLPGSLAAGHRQGDPWAVAEERAAPCRLQTLPRQPLAEAGARAIRGGRGAPGHALRSLLRPGQHGKYARQRGPALRRCHRRQRQAFRGDAGKPFPHPRGNRPGPPAHRVEELYGRSCGLPQHPCLHPHCLDQAERVQEPRAEVRFVPGRRARPRQHPHRCIPQRDGGLSAEYPRLAPLLRRAPQGAAAEDPPPLRHVGPPHEEEDPHPLREGRGDDLRGACAHGTRLRGDGAQGMPARSGGSTSTPIGESATAPSPGEPMARTPSS